MLDVGGLQPVTLGMDQLSPAIIHSHAKLHVVLCLCNTGASPLLLSLCVSFIQASFAGYRLHHASLATRLHRSRASVFLPVK